MAGHIIIPTFKLNNADIGTVVFVVEGDKQEFEIVKRIFSLLGYEKVGSRMKNPAFMELESTIKPNNKVIVIKTKSSNIKSLEDFDDYFDENYSDLFLNHGIAIRYSPIYYIWDRDPESNSDKKMRNALHVMNASRNEENNMNGLLLASYPCVEAYLISCNEKLDFLPNDKKPKRYVGECGFRAGRLDKNKVVSGAVNMLKTLMDLGAMESFADGDYGKMNKLVFEGEESLRKNNSGQYRLLSLLSVALIELGILIKNDE